MDPQPYDPATRACARQRHRRRRNPGLISCAVAAAVLFAVVPDPADSPSTAAAALSAPFPTGKAAEAAVVDASKDSGIGTDNWMERSLPTSARADRARSIADLYPVISAVSTGPQPADPRQVAVDRELIGPADPEPVAAPPVAAPPLAGPAPAFVLPAAGRYTSCFCERWGEMHGGIDLANTNGTPELAVAAGTVIVAGPASGFGQWVQIRHEDGTVTVYGHMDTIEVERGQQVAAGQPIATMGAQGNSTGPHLHFEVWPSGDRALRVDPSVWLTERGVQLPEYTP